MLRDVFFRKIQREKALFLVVEEYEKMKESNPDKSYDWLLEKV
jgi:hypothetical protein